MTSSVLFGFVIVTGVQATVNYLFSKKKRSNTPDWSYQNKEICKKNAATNGYTSLILLVLTICFKIAGC